MSDDDGEEREGHQRKVYWRGRQWCVTDYGLETLNPQDYYVEAKLLTEASDQPEGAPTIYERVRHISEKTWVDVEDLIAAFAVGVLVHGKGYPQSPMLNTIAHVRQGRHEEAVFARHAPSGGYAMNDPKVKAAFAASDAAVAKRLAEGPPYAELPDEPAPSVFSAEARAERRGRTNEHER